MARKTKAQEAEEETRLFPAAHEHDFFFGHTGLRQTLETRLASGRMHHAWLIEGLEGIGKATLSWRLARFLLAHPQERKAGLAIDKNTPAWHLTKAGSHPDFLYLSPAADSKTKTITISEIREVNEFFTKSPALSRHRVAIIDAVDNMNTNAANGLLKLLEEPPAHAVLFLVSHRAGSVLATIRSRCQKLALAPLDEAAMKQGLKTFLPDLTQADAALALHLGNRSLGRALKFAKPTARALYQAFQSLALELKHFDSAKVEKFCSLFADSENYDLFCYLMLDWSHALAATSQRRTQGLALWDELHDIMQATQRLNMDKKLAAHNMFLALERVAA